MKDFTMDSVSTGSKETKLCKKWKSRTFVFTLITALLLFSFNSSTYAQNNIQGTAPVQDPNGGFGVDGDARANFPNANIGDWFAYPGGSGGAIFPAGYELPGANFEGIITFANEDMTYFFRDDISNNDPTIFTGSNKINDDPASYEWGSGSSPNKNEIQTAAAHFTYGDGGLGGDPDDLWVVFAADRQVTNGSSYIDFEFLQNSLTRMGTASGTFVSQGPDMGRTVGDVLVTIEFTIGGGAANAVIRTWQSNGSGGYEYMLFTDYPSGTIFITNNTVETIVPWSVYGTDPIATGVNAGLYNYEINQWAEGAVNLSALFDQDDCFNISTLFVRTRTSGSSGQSELKDFPGGPVQLELNLVPKISFTNPDPVCSPATVDLTVIAVDGCDEGTLSYWMDDEATIEVENPEAVGAGTYYIQCASSANPICVDIDPVTIKVDDTPNITVTDPDAVCSPATVDITNAASGCGEDFSLSYWEDELASVALESPSAISESGTYYIKCTNNENANCFEIEPVVVIVSDTPEISVTDPNAVCSPGTVDITDAASGCGEDFSLSYWEDEFASVALENPSTISESGTYYIKCANDNNADCYDIQPVVVTIDETPDISVTDPATVCAPDTVNITGAASGCGEGYTLSYWEDENASITLGTPSAISESGTYYIKCTNNDNASCFEIEPVLVTISDTPDITVTDPNPSCSPDTVDITAAASGCGEGYSLTYWYDAETVNEIDNPASLGEGVYYIKCTNDNNESCFEVEPINVTVDETPSISITNPDPVCDPDTVDLTADGVVTGCSGNLSYWTNSTATIAVPDPEAVGGGTYYIKCTNDANENCYDIKQVDVTANDVPNITVVDPAPVCSPGTVDITGASSGCGEDSTLSYWTDAGATIELTNPSTIATSGTYYIKCTNDENNNCYDIEPVEVVISETPSIAVSDPAPVCAPETVDITGAASGCGEGFNLSYWKDAEATISLTNPLTVGESGVYYIKCTNDENVNCYNIEPVVVTIEVCAQEGCTLGYWKNHTDRWCEQYNTCTTYAEAFYDGAYSDAPAVLRDLTLLEVLNLGGGGIKNLGRQSVAALLNTCSSGKDDIDFFYSDVSILINDVRLAIAREEAGSFARDLDELNQAGCPLGNSRATVVPCLTSTNSSFDASAGISVSPVPFKDKLNIRYEFKYKSDVEIQIFDLRGNLVKSQKEKNAEFGKITEINADFVRGKQMYIIKVTTNQGVYTKNVVSGK
jgi:hypothetical protein